MQPCKLSQGSGEVVDYQTDKCHRVKYNKELHPQQGSDWTMQDYKELCGLHGCLSLPTIAAGLGRTTGAVATKLHQIKSMGAYKDLKRQFKKDMEG